MSNGVYEAETELISLCRSIKNTDFEEYTKDQLINTIRRHKSYLESIITILRIYRGVE